jgi:hypothetical protein
LEVRWRKADSLSDGGCLAPSNDGEEFFAINECLISPEAVVEYPWIESLGQAEREAIRDWEIRDAGGQFIYQLCLSTCPGTKLFGYQPWPNQSPKPAPKDALGNELEYLLTISDNEWDGGTWPRWRPVELGAWPNAHEDAAYPLGTSIDYVNVFLDRFATPWRIVAQV